jgi:hypothetical protein
MVKLSQSVFFNVVVLLLEAFAYFALCNLLRADFSVTQLLTHSAKIFNGVLLYGRNLMRWVE